MRGGGGGGQQWDVEIVDERELPESITFHIWDGAMEWISYWLMAGMSWVIYSMCKQGGERGWWSGSTLNTILCESHSAVASEMTFFWKTDKRTWGDFPFNEVKAVHSNQLWMNECCIATHWTFEVFKMNRRWICTAPSMFLICLSVGNNVFAMQLWGITNLKYSAI